MSNAAQGLTIQLNGVKRTLETTLTLEGLLRELSIPKEKVAIEINLEIIAKDAWSARILKDGDEVEIVHFVGGGAQGATPPPVPRRKAPLRLQKASSAHGTGGGAKALVIVESPAKCKTILKYLGNNFEVTASMGHVIDLPKSKMGIDIEHNFEPQYIVVKDRKKTLADLKKKAKNKEEIYLACDPDREGEAIGWHLQNALGKGKKVARVIFNEITKSAVLEAFKHPSTIDMDLVGAQQARRVLDRLVGYSLSPLLWQKVGRGLSAGRVQSVALRLVVDREREIKAFVPEEYWSIEAELKKQKGQYPSFTARLEKTLDVKTEIKDAPSAKKLYDHIKKCPFTVKEIKQQKKKRNPYPPYTTSKLQQAGYNVLRFPASKTMRIAQTLYEGVELGSEGSVGLITYMRTDSVRISESALKEIRGLILRDYGQDYLPEQPNSYKAKKQAQEAHEAIRPTQVMRLPKAIEPYLTSDQARLYSLIWQQAVSSQMRPALIAQVTADISAGEHLFRASGSRLEFKGCLAVQEKLEEPDQPLPPLDAQETLDLLKLETQQHFTKPAGRFTDASLVKALEEKGIGRPSTYAPIIQTLTGRDYIRRDGGSLVPSELGILVTDLLVQYFSKVLDYEFTAKMEENLDLVEEGKARWIEVVREFYHLFSGQLEYAKTTMQTVKRAVEATDEVCDLCGKPMVIKWGRRGKFMSCSGWPACRNAKSISTEVVCPGCHQGKLVARRAKSGRGRTFYGCTQYPACTYLVNRLPKVTDDEKSPDPGQAPQESAG
ncbi:MAG: DNA topoisomerase I [Candidatus Omnitrophica bacterium CG07_land_8_20_14_0_80_50_8]|nr:MAG: DNA topoisomerase I [Candidatus Omnitrophica bacterium CG07_land_8_20_14_0_80_50_8]